MLNRCYMCKGEEKTSDHSLLHCLKARILWQPIFALFGVEWVMHSLVGKKKKEKAWRLLLYAFLDHLEGEE